MLHNPGVKTIHRAVNRIAKLIEAGFSEFWQKTADF